jgi:hypothetical protein
MLIGFLQIWLESFMTFYQGMNLLLIVYFDKTVKYRKNGKSYLEVEF